MLSYKTLFGEGYRFSKKSLAMLGFLALFPNLLGLVVLPTVFGFNIHFFQYFIFLAAFLFGPLGGALSGAAGSVYTAMLLHNPYIVAGNIILGFFSGAFFLKTKKTLPSAMMAFAVQLPWLVSTDVLLARMPLPVVEGLVVSLLASNTVLAILAGRSLKAARKIIE
jgi:uncharacterized membrane protein